MGNPKPVVWAVRGVPLFLLGYLVLQKASEHG
jgi:hypothetical protein